MLIISFLLVGLPRGRAARGQAQPPGRRPLPPQDPRRPAGEPRRKMGRLHRRHRQPQGRQGRDPGLDGAHRRRRAAAHDREGDLRIAAAVLARRQVPGLPGRAARRRRREGRRQGAGLAARPAGRRSAAAHRGPAGCRGVRVGARRQAARAADQGPEPGGDRSAEAQGGGHQARAPKGAAGERGRPPADQARLRGVPRPPARAPLRLRPRDARSRRRSPPAITTTATRCGRPTGASSPSSATTPKTPTRTTTATCGWWRRTIPTRAGR